MLFALGQPFVFAGLLLSFLLALVLRAVAIRFTARSLGLVHRREPVTPRLREDVDPFGAVAAAGRVRAALVGPARPGKGDAR